MDIIELFLLWGHKEALYVLARFLFFVHHALYSTVFDFSPLSKFTINITENFKNFSYSVSSEDRNILFKIT